MNAERAQVGWRFWLGWVLASTVGVVVGLTVGTFVQDSAVTRGNVLGGAVIGASIGTAQWLVLRRQVSRSGCWVLASTVTVAVVGVPTYAPALVWASLIALAGYGAITGGVLVWLLRQPSREA